MPDTEFVDLEAPESEAGSNGHHVEETPAEVERDGSPLSTLRDRYKALQSPHTKDIDVPGYGGALVARYKPISEDVYKALPKKVARLPEEERRLASMIDVLIEACDSLWERHADGTLGPLRPEDDPDTPVRYGDDRLAQTLGFEPSRTTRGNVRKVFTVDGEVNAGAIQDHYIEVDAWISDVSSEVDDTLGEA